MAAPACDIVLAPTPDVIPLLSQPNFSCLHQLEAPVGRFRVGNLPVLPVVHRQQQLQRQQQQLQQAQQQQLERQQQHFEELQQQLQRLQEGLDSLESTLDAISRQARCSRYGQIFYRRLSLLTARQHRSSLRPAMSLFNRPESTCVHSSLSSQPRNVVRCVFPATGFAIIPISETVEEVFCYGTTVQYLHHHPTYNKLDVTM